ncbi:TetR/AcrR family transcriptional regulator [Microbacterium sp. ARD31]|uniref:TetR/AcrR family transcriptional regulator n=1 Tax=Microbacterium sp. ARD31 TaxID=2962576 RepID=UPI002880D475|nr:TetR/AcrR family transcriptional regulator [Microbacterium sp. ARD31]MDT0184843.1 TetR/AcrR family transcriptional regulator [Microbacterium sp. ARD31]
MTDAEPRRRLSIADRRRQIAERGVELVARYGSYGVTMRQVADAVGLTLPGLSHHVGGRDELLTLIVETQFDDDPSGALTEAVANPSTSLPGLLRAIVQRNSERPQLTAVYLLLAVEAHAADHPAHDYYVERHARITAVFRDRPWRLPERFRSDGATSDLVRTSLSALDGVQLQALTDPRESAISLWARVERTLFGGPEWADYR